MNFRNFDVVVSHHPWAVRGLALGLALFAAGCPADEGAPDGGLDAGVEDAWMPWDGGRYDGGQPSQGELDASEPTELGACSCTYGFHHQCAPSEVCAGSILGGAACKGSPPFEASESSDVEPAIDAADMRNAQCLPVASAHPCAGELLRKVRGHLRAWYEILNTADTTDGRNSESAPMWFFDAIEIEKLQRREWGVQIARQCGEFIAWTTLGVLRLCRGEEAVAPDGDYRRLTDWRFSRSARQDDCSNAAIGACVSVLDSAMYEDGISFEPLNAIALSCSSAWPMARPCDGEDALECLRARLVEIATVLRSGTNAATDEP